MSKGKAHDVQRTKANKIRRLMRELARNPHNKSAANALEFWKTHDRKTRSHRKKGMGFQPMSKLEKQKYGYDR